MHKMPEIKRPISEVTAAIKAWMSEEGFTQNSLAKHLGMPQSQVSRALKGQLPESSTALHRLCTAAGVSVHKIVNPWESPIIATAVEDAWDGSEEGARAIGMLLIAARALSAVKVQRDALPEAH